MNTYVARLDKSLAKLKSNNQNNIKVSIPFHIVCTALEFCVVKQWKN